jgi:UPF0716 protein FxsA
MPLLFIIIPLIELYFIIVVGESIGALWTVVLVVLTAIIGVNLLRIQGMSTLTRAQRNMAQGQIPAMEMMEGVALAVAGVLLITPGFITDTLGFLCLIPASRQAIIRFIMRRASVQTNFSAGGFQSYHQPGSQPGHQSGEPKTGPSNTGARSGAKAGRTIEGEYTRED